MGSFCITIDCWDTILAESRELDEFIDKEIVDWLTEVDCRITADQARQAIRAEAKNFSRIIAAADSVVTPEDRLRFLLRLLAIDANAIDRDVIDDITHRIDMSICGVRPKLTPWAEQFLCNAQEKRFAVCMISNTGWISSTAIKKIFIQENLADHFVGWFFSGDGYRPKPNPEMFRAALAELNADIAQVIHVGDQARTDGMGALAAGITPIILTGKRHESDGMQLPPLPGGAFRATSLYEAWNQILVRN